MISEVLSGSMSLLVFWVVMPCGLAVGRNIPSLSSWLKCTEHSNCLIFINLHCRRMLIEKVAAHIAEFSPRLRSNTRALYQYCAIPVVRYPQLDEELFCNIFYLRHLCDTTRFPEWPISEPVSRLQLLLLILTQILFSKVQENTMEVGCTVQVEFMYVN
jgi:hypothetical protein